MKKKLLLFVAIITVVAMCFAFTACTDKAEQEINVVVPDGAPALAIAKLLSSSSFDGYKVNYQIVPGATEITAAISNGTADIALMPTNVAAKLYSMGKDIKMVASNTFGMLYIVGTESVESISDLEGETIICPGTGGVPDFVLQYVLSANGVSSDNIEYVSDGTAAIAKLNQGQAKFALLPEPAATAVQTKVEGVTVLFDLQEEWTSLTGYDGYPQACTVVTGDMYANNQAFLKLFLAEVRSNVEWIADSANITAISDALTAYSSTSTFPSTAVIGRCNVRYVDALEAKDSVLDYLGIMKSFNEEFVGSTLPNDNFFAKVDLD